MTTSGNYRYPLGGAGGGDVTKVGIPVDNQVAVWTGDGTIEGLTGFTFDAGIARVSLQFVASSPAGGNNSAFLAQSNTPSFGWDVANATTDNRLWDIVTAGLSMAYRVVNNANTIAFNYMVVTRNLVAVTSIAMDTPAFTVTGTINGASITGAGAATNYLDETGSYSVPAGGGGGGVDPLNGKLNQQSTINPTLEASVASLAFLDGCSGVFVSGNYCYAVGFDGDELSIIDITVPSSPLIVGNLLSTSRLNGAHKLYVAGRFAYVAARNIDRLTIVDISVPNAPALRGSVLNAAMVDVTDVVVSGDYAFLCTRSTANNIVSVNIKDPDNPVFVASLSIAAQPQGLIVEGKYAYVASGTGNSLTVVDISDPASMTQVGVVTDAVNLSNASGLASVGRYVYVTAITGDRLTVVDVQNPAVPAVVANITSAELNGPIDVEIAGEYAYVACVDFGGIVVVNISNPLVPVQVGSLTDASMASTRSLSVHGGFAYVSGFTSDSVAVVDLNATKLLSANIGTVQAGTLDVLGKTQLQGPVALRSGLNVSGPTGLKSLSVGGPFSAQSVRTAVSNNTAAMGKAFIYAVTDTAAVRTITVSNIDITDGRLLVFKDESGAAGTNNITIATEGAQTIDGSPTATIATNNGQIRLYEASGNLFTW